MTRLPMDQRYSTVAIAFHWTIALLVLLNFAIAMLDLPFPGGMGSHKAIGITVLVLTVGRVAWRIVHRPPHLPARLAPWERGLAHATHWTLYLLLLAMPITGWLMVSGAATRRPLTWFGLFDLPYLPVGRAAGGFGHEAHELLGWLMLALVALHIAGALRHHFIKRDNVLARMWPGLAR